MSPGPVDGIDGPPVVQMVAGDFPSHSSAHRGWRSVFIWGTYRDSNGDRSGGGGSAGGGAAPSAAGHAWWRSWRPAPTTWRCCSTRPLLHTAGNGEQGRLARHRAVHPTAAAGGSRCCCSLSRCRWGPGAPLSVLTACGRRSARWCVMRSSGRCSAPASTTSQLGLEAASPGTWKPTPLRRADGGRV